MAADVRHLIFGFGSLVNADSRKRDVVDPAAVCVRVSSLGYVRSWNFRSPTGFTALGLRRPQTEAEGGVAINGVVFPAGLDLAALDEREAGYQRVPVPPDCVMVLPPVREETPAEQDLRALLDGDQQEDWRLWVYVPRTSDIADADHPICQSYVDTVLEGCLFHCTGEAFAREFLQTTLDWPKYFLDDTPLSRRPWLNRPHYKVIDALLREQTEHTRLHHRKHPEEFATAYLRIIRGMWGVPNRNPLFVGREAELALLRERLCGPPAAPRRTAGIIQLETVGLGGIGKTQLAIELCHRLYNTAFPLILWLRAESPDLIAEDLRRLARDVGIDVMDRSSEDINQDIRSRLFNAKCPWLVVFDNLEAASVVADYLPQGQDAASFGHVLITCRRMFPEWQDSSLSLDCFDPPTALRFLRKAAGDCAELDHADAGARLAGRLGRLPLALAMAANYMRHCDVTCAEYLALLDTSDQRLLLDDEGARVASHPLTVQSSLCLTLDRIAAESPLCRQVLNCLAFCAPEAIPKDLVARLVAQTVADPPDPQGAAAPRASAGVAMGDLRHGPPVAAPKPRDPEARGGPSAWQRLAVAMRVREASALMGVAVALCVGGVGARGRPLGRISGALGLGMAAFALHRGVARMQKGAAGAAHAARGDTAADGAMDDHEAPGTSTSAGTGPDRTAVATRSTARHSGSADSRETSSPALATDRTWKTLKTFALLQVRHRSGSIHRLMQHVLRDVQTPADARRSLAQCVQALDALWRFDRNAAETWSGAGQLLDHIKTVALHASDRTLFPLACTRLLTDAGDFVAVARSQFGEAQALLERARDILRRHDTDATPQTRAIALARTTRALGTVLRHQGAHDEAVLQLQMALQAQRELGDAAEVAQTLHEIGVTHVRMHRLQSAQEFLEEVLQVKRQLGSTDVASTLYQLAVVHTMAKPPNLDAAEAKLKHVLVVSRSSATRAATLQQLGRVCLRRGALKDAERYLRDTLELYTHTYKSDLHINVASIHFQLGNLEITRKNYHKARLALLEALRIWTAIYADNDHFDICITLQGLGKAARGEDDLQSAWQYFEAERQALQRLSATTHGAADRRLGAEVTTNLHWLRTLAKDRGDRPTALALGKQIEELKAGPPHAEPVAPPASTRPAPTPEYVAAIIKQREAVREALLSAAHASGEVPHRTLREVAEALQAAPQRHAPSDADAGLLEAAQAFAQALLRVPVTPDLLFTACDDLRSAIRATGVPLQR